jgi:hypothetical protein
MSSIVSFYLKPEEDPLSMENVKRFIEPKVIVEDTNFIAFGVDLLVLEIIKEFFPYYLISGIEIFVNIDREVHPEVNAFYLKYRDGGEVKDSIEISLSTYVLARTIYLFQKDKDVLEALGFSKEDNEERIIGAIEIQLLDTKNVKIISNIITQIKNDIEFKKHLFKAINTDLVFHELMHAFITRIYPFDSKQVTERKKTLKQSVVFLEIATDFLNLELRNQSLFTMSIEDLYGLNYRVMQSLLFSPQVNLSNPEDLFGYLFSAGIQESWIWLEEARQEILLDNVQVRSSRFVNRIMVDYIENIIFIPREVLDMITQQEFLNEQQINLIIEKGIKPLLNPKYIERVKKKWLSGG